MKVIVFIILGLCGFLGQVFAQQNQGMIFALEVTLNGSSISSGDVGDFSFSGQVVDKALPISMDQGHLIAINEDEGKLVILLMFEFISDVVPILDTDKIELTVNYSGIPPLSTTKIFQAPPEGWGYTQYYGNEGINLGSEPTGPVLKVNEIFPVCAPETVNLMASAVTDGSSPAITEWTSVKYYEDEGRTKPLANPGAISKSGIYFIHAICQTTDTTAAVVVTINPKPDVTLVANGAGGAIGNNSTVCDGTELALTAGGLSDGKYSWSKNSGTDDVFNSGTVVFTENTQSGLKPRTNIEYQVIGETAAGCKDTASVELNVMTAPILTVSPKTAEVCVGTKHTITATVTPSVSGKTITYEWGNVLGAGNTPSVTFKPATAGTMKCYIKVTEDGNTCFNTDSVDVTVKAKPTNVQITPPATLCSNAATIRYTAKAQETTGVSYKWELPTVVSGANYDYKPNGSSSPVNLKVIATLTATGCTDTVSLTSNINPAPTAAKPTVTIADVCAGTDVALDIPSPTPGYTYEWSTGATGTSVTAVAAAGEQWFRVNTKDTKGCSATDSVKVIGHKVRVNALTKNPTSGTTPGDNVTLSTTTPTFQPATGVMPTYQWKPADKIASGAGTLTAVADGSKLMAGTTDFWFVAKDQYGCADSAKIQVVVDVLEPLKIDKVVYETAYCKDGKDIELEVRYSGGKGGVPKTVTWTGDAALGALNGQSSGTNRNKVKIPTGTLAAGSYTVTVKVAETDAIYIDSTFTFQLNDVPKFDKFTPQTLCAGGSVTLAPQNMISAAGIKTYSWTNFSGLSGSSIEDNKESVLAVAGAGKNKFVLKVTDNNSCFTIDTAVVIGNKVTVELGADLTRYYGATAALKPQSISYIPADAYTESDLTYLWTPAASIDGTNTDKEITTLPLLSDTKFYLTVTGAKGGVSCSAKDSVSVIIQGAALTIDPKTAVASAEYCESDTVKLLPNVTGGSGKYTFEWTAATPVWTSADSVAKITGWAAGSYTAALTVTDTVTKYSVTGNVTFTIYPAVMIKTPVLAALSGSADTCTGSSVQFSFEAQGGTAPLNYTWSGGAVSSAQNPLLAIASGKQDYIVAVTDAKGCTVKDTVTITGHSVDVKSIAANPSSGIEYKGTTELTPTVDFTPAGMQGTVTYAWRPAGLVGTPDVDGKVTSKALTADTTFTLVVTDQFGCVDSASTKVMLKAFTPLQIDVISPDSAYCLGDDVKLNVKLKGGDENNYTYAWSADGITIANANTASATVDAAQLAAGQTYEFKLQVSDNADGLGGAVIDTVVHIEIKALPAVQITDKSRVACKWGEATFEAVATDVTYAWSAMRGSILSGRTTAAAKVKISDMAGEDKFIVTVKDINTGCINTDTATVKVHVITLPTVNESVVACGTAATLTLTPGSCSMGDNLSYTWGPADLFASATQSGAVTVELDNGRTELYVAVKDDTQGCQDTLRFGVTSVGCDFTITVPDNAIVCEGGKVQIPVTSTKTGVVYQWNAVSGDGSVDNTGLVDVAGLTAKATYQFAVAATYTTNGLDVVRKDTVDVYVRKNPVVDLQGDDGCTNTLVTLQAVVTDGEGGDYDYQWTGAQKVTASPDKATLTLAAGMQNVGVTVTDAEGCSLTVDKDLKGEELMATLAVDPETQVQPGDNVTLKGNLAKGTVATTTFTYSRIQPDHLQLASGTGLLQTTDAPAAVSKYRLTVMSLAGCKDSVEILVNVKDDDRLLINGNNLEVCAGATDLSAYKFSARTYGGQIPYTYKWEVEGGKFTINDPVSIMHGEGSEVTLASIPLIAGTYRVIVTVTDADGRTTNKGLTLTVNKQPEIKINGEKEGDMSACAGTGDYTVLATGPAGTTFKWGAPATLLNRTDAEQKISVATASAGIPVTVTGTWNGCATTVTRNLVVHAAPQLALTADKEEGCAGAEVVLSAKATGTKPFIYTWTGAARKAGADSAAVLTLAAGQNPVSVSVKDNNGCETTVNKILTGHTIDVNLTGVPSVQIAQGETVKLKATATGGKAAEYAFVKVETASTTPVITGAKDTVSVTPAASSVYRVVVTSDKGCKDSADYRVNVGSATPSITVSDIAVCQGTADVQATAEALGGEANYTYNWTVVSVGTPITITPATHTDIAGASTVTLGNLSALSAGIYNIKVDVTDKNANTVSKNFKLTVKARPVIKINNRLTASDTTFCLNTANAKLTATGATAYQWLTPAGVAGNRDAGLTLNTAVASAATEYKVVGTTDGCSDTATINVTIQALPTVTITGAELACVGSVDTELAATAAGGVAPYKYTWTGATEVTGQPGKAIANAVNKDNTYQVTVEDANKCTATATHQIAGHKLEVFLSYSPSPANLNEKTVLQASVTGGTATNYEFKNVTDGVTIKNSAVDTAWVYPSKITKYQVYVTSETLRCIDSMATPLTMNVKNQPLKVEGTDRVVCEATPDGNITVEFTATATGGTGQYKYTWSVVDSPDQIKLVKTAQDIPGEYASSTNKLKSIGNVPAGVYTIKVEVEDVDIKNTLLTKDTIMYLTVRALPQITISGKQDGSDTIVCQSTDQLVLTAADTAGGTEWKWAAAGNFGANPNKSVSVATADLIGTAYRVYGKNTLGCIDSASITVKVNPRPTVNIAGAGNGCEGQNIQLAAVPSGGTAPYKKKGYQWVSLNSSNDATTLAEQDSVISVKLNSTINRYQVVVTDTNGCTSDWSSIHSVTAVKGAAISKLFVQDSCSVGRIVVRALNAEGYTWKKVTAGITGDVEPGSADSIYRVTSPGLFTMRVIAQSSVAACSDSATISGQVWDVSLTAGLVSEKDTCGAEKLALNITKVGTSAITGVKLTYTVNNTLVDTIFDATKLADASIRVTQPGTYKLVSIADTTSRCPGTIDVAKDSVRVGFRPEVDILPHTAHDTLNVEAGTQFVLRTAKKCNVASADYTWTPVGKFTAYATPDSISHTLAEGEEVKYTLTAKGTDAVGCVAKDSIVVRIGTPVVDLEAPVVAIDTNDNRLSIKIHWPAVDGATSYNVYRRKWDPYCLTAENGQVYTKVNVNATEFTLAEADLDTLEFFYVTAANGDVESAATSDTVGYKLDNILVNTNGKSSLNLIVAYFDFAQMGLPTTDELLLKPYSSNLLMVRKWSFALQDWEFSYAEEGEVINPFVIDLGMVLQFEAQNSFKFLQYGILPKVIEFELKNSNPKYNNNIVFLQPFRMTLSNSGDVFTEMPELSFIRRWNFEQQDWEFTYVEEGEVIGAFDLRPVLMPLQIELLKDVTGPIKWK